MEEPMKKGLHERRMGAYERLLVSQFFPKGDRTEESWSKNKEKELEVLRNLLNIRK
jgi:hypothetical protein